MEVDYLGHASFLLTFPRGFTVLKDYGASNAWGDAALAAHSAGNLELVITDLATPARNGLRLIQDLRSPDRVTDRSGLLFGTPSKREVSFPSVRQLAAAIPLWGRTPLLPWSCPLRTG